MGLGHSALKVLLNENNRCAFKGKDLLSLGRQDIFVTEAKFLEILSEFSLTPIARPQNILSYKGTEAEKGFISDDYVYSALGFSSFKSLDASAYEGADIIFDLNTSTLPDELKSSSDVILDAGTLEHIFNVPVAMSNIFKMLRVGGRVIHQAPSSNHIDHGFYMFSPTFFWDFYLANGFDVDVLQVARYSTDWLEAKWEISDYHPGSLIHKSIGGLDDGIYMILTVATKTARSTGNVIPQQGMYESALWEGQKTPQGVQDSLGKKVDENFTERYQRSGIVNKLLRRHVSPEIKAGVENKEFQRGTGLPLRYKA